jgi:hypothetical protein
LAFDASALPKLKAAPVRGQTAEQLQQFEARLPERDEKLAALPADKTALDEELKRLRVEVAAAAKQAAAAQPDMHDYAEAETRDYVIGMAPVSVPDFLIRLQNGKTPILEIKGEDTPQNKAKRSALDAWVRAVSCKCGFGTRCWNVAFRPEQIHDILAQTASTP